ncbi:hypothetical protein DXH95_03035 [Sphingorhabdus pulchriflava]|uniref:Phage DNA packaging protein, Nu1 subunit of terminase n=1 Tax=Sphingorhabdus pulchriflava TaxID=2292257 RepID=A0A371BFN6_9SPHN|nr:hypothetical protein [Sphingorhabdus pulchriflava]RDV06416.1 hypothetical protein DXH95_03035 [Sphingorhabdus pulchriflava]
MGLIVDLNEFSELCGVTAETMRAHIKSLTEDPLWMIKRGTRGSGYEIDAEGGVAWWKDKRASEETASADRRAQLAQLRLDLLGDAVEDEERLGLSGRQRLDDYAAALKRIELGKAMGQLIERGPLEAALSAAAVEHRRVLQLIPGQMMAETGLSNADAAKLEALLGKAIDDFWNKQFMPPKPASSGHA